MSDSKTEAKGYRRPLPDGPAPSSTPTKKHAPNNPLSSPPPSGLIPDFVPKGINPITPVRASQVLASSSSAAPKVAAESSSHSYDSDTDDAPPPSGMSTLTHQTISSSQRAPFAGVPSYSSSSKDDGQAANNNNNPFGSPLPKNFPAATLPPREVDSKTEAKAVASSSSLSLAAGAGASVVGSPPIIPGPAQRPAGKGYEHQRREPPPAQKSAAHSIPSSSSSSSSFLAPPRTGVAASASQPPPVGIFNPRGVPPPNVLQLQQQQQQGTQQQQMQWPQSTTIFSPPRVTPGSSNKGPDPKTLGPVARGLVGLQPFQSELQQKQQLQQLKQEEYFQQQQLARLQAQQSALDASSASKYDNIMLTQPLLASSVAGGPRGPTIARPAPPAGRPPPPRQPLPGSLRVSASATAKAADVGPAKARAPPNRMQGKAGMDGGEGGAATTTMPFDKAPPVHMLSARREKNQKPEEMLNYGWWRFTDPESRVEYFWNELSGESQYERPFEYSTVKGDVFATARNASGTFKAPTSKALEDLNNGWGRYVDEATRVQYFYNSLTGEGQWERPDDFSTRANAFAFLRQGDEIPASALTSRRTGTQEKIETLQGGWAKYRDPSTVRRRKTRRTCRCFLRHSLTRSLTHSLTINNLC